MKKGITYFIIFGVLLLSALWTFPGIITSNNTLDPALYAVFCNAVTEDTETPPKWHIAIYLNVNACLTCNEDMDAWRELQEKLPECNAILSLWAPRTDSLDVARAMKLEGLNSPVYVLDSQMVTALGWENKETPIKVLLDKQCYPIKIIHWLGNSKLSKLTIEKLISEISS